MTEQEMRERIAVLEVEVRALKESGSAGVSPKLVSMAMTVFAGTCAALIARALGVDLDLGALP